MISNERVKHIFSGNGTWSFFYNGTKVGTYAFTGASTGYNFTFIHTVGSGSDMGALTKSPSTPTNATPPILRFQTSRTQ